jgi:hypothetical protein
MSSMQQEKQAVTLQNLAGSKLLNFTTKDMLKQFLTPVKYAEVEQRLRQTLNKERINLKEIKQYLSTRDDFLASLRASPIGAQSFGKYRVAAERMQNMEIRARSQNTRKVMQQPRARYKGCLATKVPIEAYETCLFDYDDEKYDNLSLVPSKLKERVYETGSAETRNVLGPSVLGKKFSDFPTNLKTFISRNPDEFRSYYQQRHSEVNLMKSVLSGLSPQEKQKLKEHYREHRNVDTATLKSILGLQSSSSASSSSKRSRPASIVKGGCDKGPDCKCEGGNGGDYFSDTSSISSLTSSMASLMR